MGRATTGAAGALALALLAAAPAAHGATVTMRHEVADRAPTALETLHVEEPAGERNDLRLTWTADRFVVEDALAPVTAGPGCVQDGPGRATCAIGARTLRHRFVTAVLDAGDGDDVLRNDSGTGLAPGVQLRGGGGEDLLIAGAAPPPRAPGDLAAGVGLDGGDGRDTLLGGPGGEALSGGEGEDVLHGGPGDDVLHGESLSTLPGVVQRPDVLDGGPGRDLADYANVDLPVAVDLADPAATDGTPGEHDDLRAIEDVRGGERDDVLRGDDGPNRLSAGNGDSALLDGRGGDDELRAPAYVAELVGGAGDDLLVGGLDPYFTVPAEPFRCGPGLDVVRHGAHRTIRRVGADCERVDVAGSFVAHVASARLRGRTAELGITPRRTTRGVLRLSDARGRTVARRTLRLRGRGFRRIVIALRVAPRAPSPLRLTFRPTRAPFSGGFTLAFRRA